MKKLERLIECLLSNTTVIIIGILYLFLAACSPNPCVKPPSPLQHIYIEKIELNNEGKYEGKYKYTIVVHLQSVHVENISDEDEKSFYYYSSNIFSAGDSLFLRCNH